MLLQGEFYSLVAYSFITELQGELSFMSACKRDREILLCRYYVFSGLCHELCLVSCKQEHLIIKDKSLVIQT